MAAAAKPVSAAARKKVAASGIPAEQHDRTLALKAAGDKRGLDFNRIIEAIKKYGPTALEILERLLGVKPPKPAA